MDGLLLKLREDKDERPGFWFWKLFSSIRQDVDRYYWCFVNQPWMALPQEIFERQGDFAEEVYEPFEERAETSIQLWRPETLSKYAEEFAEEYIELWAIDPDLDVPSHLATQYSDSNWDENIVQKHAQLWLIYTDSTCWEIFTRKPSQLDRINQSLINKPWVDVYKSESDRRGLAFDAAGLSEVWQNL